MPSYKLTYFDLTALGEPIRMLFTYGGIPYTDERIQKADWPQLKPKTPFGVVPILDVDGKIVLHQSVAIARYVANLVHLVGKDPLENAQIDAAVDTVNDVRAKLGAYFFEADATRKSELKKQVENEVLPFFLSRLDAQAKTNKGYLAVNRLTWADFFLAGLWEFIAIMAGGDLWAKYPNLQQVYKNVLAIPKIRTYVDRRPKDNL